MVLVSRAYPNIQYMSLRLATVHQACYILVLHNLLGLLCSHRNHIFRRLDNHSGKESECNTSNSTNH